LKVELTPRRVPMEAIVAAFFGLSATLSGAGHWGAPSSFVLFAFALLLWGVAASGLKRFFRSANPAKSRSANLTVDERGVCIDGALVLPRADVTRGFVVPKASSAALVRIEGKGGREVEVEVPDPPAAADLLRELALGTDHGAMKLRVFVALAPPLVRATALITSGFFALGLAIYGMIAKHFEYGFVFLLAQAGPHLLGQIEATLVIGKDGVHAARLGGGRFLSFDDFESVERTSLAKPSTRRTKKPVAGSHLTVKLKATGERVALDEYLGIKWPDAATCDAAAELITHELDARKSGGPARAVDVLARGERSTGNWISELKRLTRREGYRDLAVPTEQLIDVVEDAAAAPALRLAAAIALRGDATAMTRVQTAALQSASPRIRVALEHAVTAEDEAQLASQLEELDEYESQRVG
jgi:hypothetical protein